MRAVLTVESVLKQDRRTGMLTRGAVKVLFGDLSLEDVRG